MWRWRRVEELRWIRWVITLARVLMWLVWESWPKGMIALTLVWRLFIESFAVGAVDRRRRIMTRSFDLLWIDDINLTKHLMFLPMSVDCQISFTSSCNLSYRLVVVINRLTSRVICRNRLWKDTGQFIKELCSAKLPNWFCNFAHGYHHLELHLSTNLSSLV